MGRKRHQIFIRDHLFRADETQKLLENLHFLSVLPTIAFTYQGERNVSFSEDSAYLLNE